MINQPDPPFSLTQSERDSPLWRKLMAYWESQLSLLRIQNDGQLPDMETAKLRGQIARLKATMSLDKELPHTAAQ